MGSVPARQPPAFILPECEGTDACEESYAWDGVTSEARIIQTLHGPFACVVWKCTAEAACTSDATHAASLLHPEAAPLMEAWAVAGGYTAVGR